jgi:hypothetical protein
MTQDTPSQLTRPLHPVPDSVKNVLVSRGLLDAYNRRPPYQRNDYIGWITRAKGENPRKKRLAQMLDELAAGNCYMGMRYKENRPETVLDYLGPEILRFLATPSNLRLGEEIARSKGVELIEYNPALILAKVRPEGGQRRTVELRLTEKQLTWQCTCTRKGKFCSHCVAVAITARVNHRPLARILLQPTNGPNTP